MIIVNKLSSIAKLNSIMVAGMCVAVISGCATKPPVKEGADKVPENTVEQKINPPSNMAAQLPVENAEPEWIRKGNAAFPDFGKNAYYGVGSSFGISNLPLATKAADEQAKANLAEGIKVNLDDLFKQYSRSASANGAEESEHDVRQVTKAVVSATLIGAFVIDHWTDPANGRVYALARMDIDSAKRDMLKQLNNGGFKDFVKENADKAFADVESPLTQGGQLLP